MRFAMLTVIGLAACNNVPTADAQTFLADIEQIAASNAPQDMHTTLLMSACADVASCAGACSEAFKAAPKYAEDDQRRLIAQCSREFREAATGPAKLSLGTWLRRYIGQYVMRARKELDSGEQARLDAAIEKLGH